MCKLYQKQCCYWENLLGWRNLRVSTLTLNNIFKYFKHSNILCKLELIMLTDIMFIDSRLNVD